MSESQDKEPENRYFECACGSYGHPLKLSYFPAEDNYPAEMFICFQCEIYGSLWKRIREALGYVFKRKPWDYDDFTLTDRKTRDEIVEFLSKL